MPGKIANTLLERYTAPDGTASTPEIDALVEQLIGRVADKWTLLTIEALAMHGRVRFSRLAELVGGVSQKMLTKTLRDMEADGFVTRTVHAEVPPRVEYELTALGHGLGHAFCGVWEWAEKHYGEVRAARAAYAKKNAKQK